MKKTILLVVLCYLLTLTISCVKEPQIVLVTGVSLDKATVELVEGGSVELEATISPSNSDNQNLLWTSTNSDVATVINGFITAHKIGSTTVTVKTVDGGYTASCLVTVIPKAIAVRSVSLSKSTLKLSVGETDTLFATVLPDTASDKNVTWKSSNPTIVTVSSNGVVTGKSAGSATITVTTSDGNWKATCSVIVSSSALFSNYLTFTSEGTTSITLENVGGNSPKLYYSFNKKDWNQWDYSSLSFTKDKPLYLCGDNLDGLCFDSEKKWSSFQTTGSYYSCSGSIMSLINKDEPVLIIPSHNCFTRLFAGNYLLKSAPSLPAMDLSNASGCYSYMFNACSALTTAPDLPALVLSGGCYSHMFVGCTSLKQAPELPSTILAPSCYQDMFNGCTALTTAPDLPATKLEMSCYWNMFSGCSSLIEAPELPAINIEYGCYDRMFLNCTSLATPPILPATSMKPSCYYGMFWGCSSLEIAPELPATTLAHACYSSMFEDCTKLTTAPKLPATTLADDCYGRMFKGCISLTTAPDLPAKYLVTSCYSRMFYLCSNLSFIKCLAIDISPVDANYYWLYGVSSKGTFVKNPAMNNWPSGPGGIPNGWTVVNDN